MFLINEYVNLEWKLVILWFFILFCWLIVKLRDEFKFVNSYVSMVCNKCNFKIMYFCYKFFVEVYEVFFGKEIFFNGVIWFFLSCVWSKEDVNFGFVSKCR